MHLTNMYRMFDPNTNEYTFYTASQPNIQIDHIGPEVVATPLIQALRRQRQVNLEFEISLVYRMSSKIARNTQRNPLKNK